MAVAKKNELINPSIGDNTEILEQTDPIRVENGYLVFKTKEIFDSVRFEIEKYSLEECLIWERTLNFISAKTQKYLAEEEALKICNSYEIRHLKEKYNQFFNINNDLDVKYKFYSKGLEDVLNIDGLVKIENSLYKFTSEKEYIILDEIMLK